MAPRTGLRGRPPAAYGPPRRGARAAESEATEVRGPPPRGSGAFERRTGGLLRRLVSASLLVNARSQAELLEQAKPDLRPRREARDGVAQPRELHLADDGDGRGMDELGRLRARDRGADEHAAGLV